MRRNFLVPVPRVESFEALNAHLEQRCLVRMDAQLRGQSETIGQRVDRDLDALAALGLGRLRQTAQPGQFTAQVRYCTKYYFTLGGGKTGKDESRFRMSILRAATQNWPDNNYPIDAERVHNFTCYGPLRYTPH